MAILFFISNIFVLLCTFFLLLWGIYCIVKYKKMIRTVDKFLLIIPLLIPVNTIKKNISETENIHGLIVFLTVVNYYKIVFAIDILICIIFSVS